MPWLMIEPSDVWMFRDGKPFNAGEGHIAQSVFPPSPLTLQGALREMVMEQRGVSLPEYIEYRTQASRELGELIGPPIGKEPAHGLGMFKQSGPFLARWDHDRKSVRRYLPVPADIVAHKDAELDIEDTSLEVLELHQPEQNSDILSDYKTLYWHGLKKDFEAVTGRWLSDEGLSAYLQGSPLHAGMCLKADALFTSEYRFGTAIDYQRNRVRKEEGMLYSAQFIRLTDHTGLLVHISDEISLPSEGWFKLGGEGRGAHFTRLEPEQVYHIQYADQFRVASNQIKIVFLTPTYFENGWQPSNWMDVFGQNVEIVSAIVSRPLHIGGWNPAERVPRIMKRYVAPGSVYYLAFDKHYELDLPFITDTAPDVADLGRLGFGQYAAGLW